MKMNRKTRNVLFVYIPTIILLSVIIGLFIWISGVKGTIGWILIVIGLMLISIDLVLHINSTMLKKVKKKKTDKVDNDEEEVDKIVLDMTRNIDEENSFFDDFSDLD